MFKASDEVTRARLRKLEQGKYIKSKSFPNLAGNPKAYMLLERAYDHLDIPYRRRKFPSPFFLAHSLDLITIQIHLENVWFADHPRVSIPWCFNESKMHLAEGNLVRSIHDRYTVNGQTTAITPDLAFSLEHKGTDNSPSPRVQI